MSGDEHTWVPHSHDEYFEHYIERQDVHTSVQHSHNDPLGEGTDLDYNCTGNWTGPHCNTCPEDASPVKLKL